MPKIHLSPERTVATKKKNIGKIILFCEGKTEKYYFDYFADIINVDGNKYNNVVVQTKNVGGNAQRVLDFAEDFLIEESNNRIYSSYGKYLIFDCDAPKDISSVINSANNSTKDYILLISNHFFETWLLMHFEDVDSKLSKRVTYQHLSLHLTSDYKKGQKGRTREILHNGDIEKAIENAKRLAENYSRADMTIYDSIDKMNPYSNIYTLVEQLMLLIS